MRRKLLKRRGDGKNKSALESKRLIASGKENAQIVAGEDLLQEVEEVVIMAEEISEALAHLRLGDELHPDTGNPHHGENLTRTFLQVHDEDGATPGRSRVRRLARFLHRVLRRVDHVMGVGIDPGIGDGGVQLVALVLQIGGIPGSRADAAQMPVMIELDPLFAVFHLAHVLPGETGEIDQALHATFRDRPYQKTAAQENLHLHQDLDPGRGQNLSPAHVLAPEVLAAGVATGGDLRLTIPELIEEMHALMLASAVDPVMIAV